MDSSNKVDSEAADNSTAVTRGSDEPGDDEISANDNEVEAVEGKDGQKAAGDDDDKGPKRPPSDGDKASSTKLASGGASATQKAICRATTNAMKAASAASAACGVLSVTTIILEAKNMTDTLEKMKQGNRCEKADVILAIKAEVDKLPDTSLIAKECESYLDGTADEAQPAALTMRQRDAEKPRSGIPIKLT